MPDAPPDDKKEKTYDIGVWLGYLREKVSKEIFNMELRTGLIYELNNLEDERKRIENGLRANKTQDNELAALNKDIQRVEDNIEKAKSVQYIKFAFMESEKPSALDARYKLELEEVVKSIYNSEVSESAEALLQQIIDEINFESDPGVKQRKIAESLILLNTLIAHIEVESRKGHVEKVISLLQNYVTQVKGYAEPQEVLVPPKPQELASQIRTETPNEEKQPETTEKEPQAPEEPKTMDTETKISEEVKHEPVGEESMAREEEEKPEQISEEKTEELPEEPVVVPEPEEPQEEKVIYPMTIAGKNVEVMLPKITADRISELFQEQAKLNKTLQAIEDEEGKKKTKSDLTKLRIEIYKLIKPYLPK